MKVKEESEKVGLKLNIQKIKIMAYGPITSWQIDGKTVADFFGLHITADGDFSHKIKRCLLLENKEPHKARQFTHIHTGTQPKILWDVVFANVLIHNEKVIGIIST